MAQALPTSTSRRVSTLAGGHLSPVHVSLSAEDIDPRLALLGSRRIELGDLGVVEKVAEEVSGWVWPLSKGPEGKALGAADDGVVDGPSG